MPDTTTPILKNADKNGRTACLSVFDAPKGLLKRYRRIALISHARHLKHLDKGDAETLVVSSDWLVWQTCAQEGYHAAFGDLGLLFWTGADEFSADVMVRANDWVYVDGEDATLYSGVSLGKQAVRSVTVFMVSFERMTRALTKMIETYRPEELILFDYRSDFNALDTDMRRFLVSGVAKETGVRIVDRWDPVAPSDPSLPMAPEGLLGNASGNSLKSALKKLVLFVYSHAIDMTSRVLKVVHQHKKRVFVLVNVNIGDPLMEAFDGRGLAPVVPFQNQRKNLSLVFGRLRRGILFAGRPKVSLNRGDRRQIEAIKERLEKAWCTPGDRRTEAIRSHVRAHFIESGRMFALARNVKEASKILDRYSPAEVLVDGVLNPPTRIYIEIARNHAIPVSYTWHSVMPPMVQNWDSLGSDPRCPPLVTRILTWGSFQEKWRRQNAAGINPVLSGTPIQDRYVSLRRNGHKRQSGGKALVLEYTIGSSDVTAVHGVRFEFFVRVVRMLENLGYTDIRFKLHPGRPNKAYYDAIRERFGLRCTVHKKEPFGEMLDFADFVIGPAITGARFEALGAGKPYYAVAIPPCGFDVDSLRDDPVYVGFDALEQALGDMAPQDNAGLLNAYCSTNDIPEPARRIW